MQVSVISGVNVTVTSVESPLNVTVATIPIYPGYDPAGLASIVDTEIAKNQVTGQFSISGSGSITISSHDNIIVIGSSGTSSSLENVVFTTGFQNINDNKTFNGQTVFNDQIVVQNTFNNTSDGYGLILNITTGFFTNGIINYGINVGQEIHSFEGPVTFQSSIYDWSLVDFSLVGPYISINVNERQLCDTDGSTVTLDWKSKILNDSQGINSIDWNGRILKDYFQNYSILYHDRILRDAAQNEVMDWNNKWLVDTSDLVTVDWQDKNLFSSWTFGDSPLLSSINTGHFTNVASITRGNISESTTVGYDNIVPSHGVGFYRLWNNIDSGIEGGIYGYSTPNWGGGLVLQIKNGDGIQNGPTTTAAIFQSDGNVCIGSGLATNKLEVKGSFKANQGSFSSLSINGSSVLSQNSIISLRMPLNSGIISQVISYGQVLSSVPDSINCTLENISDNLIYNFMVSSVNISGFTISFSDNLSNTGYMLNSLIIL